jgi:hypothetical protein
VTAQRLAQLRFRLLRVVQGGRRHRQSHVVGEGARRTGERIGRYGCGGDACSQRGRNGARDEDRGASGDAASTGRRTLRHGVASGRGRDRDRLGLLFEFSQRRVQSRKTRSVGTDRGSVEGVAQLREEFEVREFSH